MYLVAISSYAPRGSANASALVAQLLASRPGTAQFDLCVVTNSDSIAGAPRVSSAGGIWRIDRPNTGMNIGAWDCAWRTLEGYDGYLFLQDECRLVRDGWVDAFATAAAASAVGMLGETTNARWARPWHELMASPLNGFAPQHFIDGAPARRVECYLDFMERHGIDPGADAGHLRSLVWFCTRDVLVRIGGFPCGRNRGECIGAEIAVSRKIVQAGLRFGQVAAESFAFFRHLEWRQDGTGKLETSAGA